MTRPPRANAGPAARLADVARVAGVSEITVSRVIRSKGPIADATRERVLAAIRKVGYLPNRVAGVLSSAGSDLIGVVIPSLANIVFPDVLRGIDAAMSPHGFRTVLSVTEYRAEAESHRVESILAWRPAALIIAGLEHRPETVDLIRATGIPVVEIMDVEGTPIDIAVGMSHGAAGTAIAAHLLDRGYRTFGYVGHDMGRDRRAGKRHAAFTAGILAAGGRLVGEEIIDAASSVAAGRQGLAALLQRHPDIEAVQFSNDDMAIGGVFHALAQGIRLPDRLAIAGFNGIDIGQQLPQPLTTILSHRFQIGHRAGEAVLARLGGRAVDSVIDLGFSLITGATA